MARAGAGGVDIGRLDLRPLLQRGARSAGGEVARRCRTSWSRSPRASCAWATRRSRNLAGTVERRGGIWQSAKLTRQHRGQPGQPRRRHADAADRRHPARQRRRLADPGLQRARTTASAAAPSACRPISTRRAARSGGSGDLKIRNFTLWGAPTIARIISLASFSGLANALSGRGRAGDAAGGAVPAAGPDVLTLEQARLVGQRHRRARRRHDRFRHRPAEHHRHGGARLHGQPDPRAHPDHRPDPVRLAAPMRRWPRPSASPARWASRRSASIRWRRWCPA